MSLPGATTFYTSHLMWHSYGRVNAFIIQLICLCNLVKLITWSLMTAGWLKIKPAGLIEMPHKHECHYSSIPILQDLQLPQTFPVLLAFWNTNGIESKHDSFTEINKQYEQGVYPLHLAEIQINCLYQGACFGNCGI